jgi:hypothetical protein
VRLYRLRWTSPPDSNRCCLPLFCADLFVSVLFFVFSGGAALAQQYVIPTYAGGAPPATPAKATDMIIGTPTAVVADPAGNVYFTGLQCVFRLDPSGVVTRIAGNSRSGYGGDGGPSTDAQLSVPIGLALDSSGNLFIADSGNYRVRRISPDGIIVTVAGNGSPGYSGEGGPAVSAAIYATALSIDNAGNLFIAGFNPAVGVGLVLKVSPAGVISTVAGTGPYGFSGDNGPATQATFSELAGIAVDHAGNLFIADYYNRRLRKVSPDGVITTVAGGGTDSSGNSGPATNASLDGPSAVVVDVAGNVIFFPVPIARGANPSPARGPFEVHVAYNEFISKAMRAMLENISHGGTRLRIAVPILVGSPVELRWTGRSFTGTVRYCHSSGGDYVIGFQKDPDQDVWPGQPHARTPG